jgi:hypothetical protein
MMAYKFKVAPETLKYSMPFGNTVYITTDNHFPCRWFGPRGKYYGNYEIPKLLDAIYFYGDYVK